MKFERRLEEIRARIAGAGGDPARVTVVAVTKGRSPEACREAHAAGLPLGENRVQELQTRQGLLPEARWHFVGTLQVNKARAVAGRVELIQSVDSHRLALELAQRGGHSQAVLLQVNVTGEPSKHGFVPGEALDAVVRVAQLLDVRGLMGMAAAQGDPAPAFAEMSRLRALAEARLDRELPVLSMGMSGDFEAAVRAGSTMVRIGRALFD